MSKIAHAHVTSQYARIFYEDTSLHVFNKNDVFYSVIVKAVQSGSIYSMSSEDFQTSNSKFEEFCNGRFAIRNNSIFYVDENGVSRSVDIRIHTLITRLIKAGDDFEPIMKFWVKLQANPSDNSRNQLWDFMCNQNIPITPEGDVVGYRAVSSSYMDMYSGTFDNSPGSVVEMDREECLDDPSQPCAAGLHVGSLEYVNWYKRHTSKVIIAKFSPTDVVSVPRDDSHVSGSDEDGNPIYQKIRVCRFESLADYTGPLENGVYFEDDKRIYDPEE
jgi:hypothetical protein